MRKLFLLIIQEIATSQTFFAGFLIPSTGPEDYVSTTPCVSTRRQDEDRSGREEKKRKTKASGPHIRNKQFMTRAQDHIVYLGRIGDAVSTGIGLFGPSAEAPALDRSRYFLNATQFI